MTGFRNPQEYGAAGGGGATNKVALWHSGSVSFYETIAEAEAAAVVNDILDCYGTFDENNLGKAGIGYFFPPGAGVTYTGSSAASIWKTKGAGETYKVSGYGAFVRNGSTSGYIVEMAHANAQIFLEAQKLEGLTNTSNLINGSFGKLYCDIDYLHNADGNIVFFSGGTIWGNLDEIYASNTGHGVNISGATAFLDIDYVNVYGRGIEVNGGMANIHVKRITNLGWNNSAIDVTGGTAYIDVMGEATSDGSHVVSVSGGTLNLEGRFKTNRENASAVKVSGGTCRIEGGSVLLGNGTGYAVAADGSARDVILLGQVASNKGLDANVTARVGSLLTDSTYVS